MKRKHSLEKMFHSVFGNHIDIENSEALPNREDIDKHIEKILKMLHSEESGEVSHENTFNKSELVSLINDFHTGYLAVYGRYDNLMGKLKKRIRPNSSDNRSFSIDFTSSDSDSSDSRSDKKEKRNKLLEDFQTLQGEINSTIFRKNELEALNTEMNAKLEEEQTLAAELAESVKVLEAENIVLKKELETWIDKEEDMNQKIRYLREENEGQRLEIAEAFARVHEADKSIESFHIELSAVQDEMQKVKSENSFLKEELEKTSAEAASLNQQLASLSEEKESLRSGNYVLLNKIQDAEKALADCRDQAEQKTTMLAVGIDTLKNENSKLFVDHQNLKLELEGTKEKVSELNLDLMQLREENKAYEEEKTSLLLELATLRGEFQQAGIDVQKLNDQIGMVEEENSKLKHGQKEMQLQKIGLEERLGEKLLEISSLGADLEVAKQEASDQIKAIMENVNSLEVETDLLSTQKSKMEETVASLTRRSEEDRKLIQELQDELKSSSSNAESTLKAQKDSFDELLANYKKLEEELQDANLSFEKATVGLEATKGEVSELKLVLESIEGEKHSLVTENSALLIKVQQGEKAVTDFEEENSKLKHGQNEMQLQKIGLEERLAEKLLEISSLGADLEVAKQEASDQIKAIMENVNNLEVERDLLNTEKSKMEEAVASLTHRSEEDQKLIQELQDELKSSRSNAESTFKAQKDSFDELLANYKKLEEELQDANLSFEKATVGLEATKGEVSELKLVLESIEGEKHSLVTENSALLIKVQQAEKAVTDFEEENSKLKHGQNEMQLQKIGLEERLVEKLLEISSLGADLEVAKQEASDQIKAIMENVNNLEVERDLLNTEKSKMEEAVASLTHRSEEDQKLIQELQDELKSSRSNAESTFKAQKDSFDELLANYKKLEEELQDANLSFEKATVGLEATKGEVSELKLVLESIEGEKLSLVTENSALLIKVQQAEKAVTDFEEENLKLKIGQNEMQLQKIRLEERLAEKLLEISSLGADLEVTKQEASDQIKAIMENVNSLEVERDLLNTQKSKMEEMVASLTHRSEEDQKLIQELQDELKCSSSNAESTFKAQKHSFDELLANYKKLEEELQDANLSFEKATGGLEATKGEVSELKLVLESIEGEKHSLVTENSALLIKVQQAEKAVTDFEEENSKLKHGQNEMQLQKIGLEERLAEKLLEISSLGEDLEIAKQEASDQIKAIMENVNSLEVERDLLNTQKSKMEETVASLTHRSEEDQKLIQELQDELKSSRSNAESTFKAQKDSFDQLLANYKKLEEELQDANLSFEKATVGLEATKGEVSELKLVLESIEGEKHSLVTENSALLIKVQQAEKAVTDFKESTKQLENDKSQLQIKINDLSIELQDLNKALSAVEEEKSSLGLEIAGVLIKLEQAEVRVKEREDELEQLKDEIGMVNLKVQEAEKIIDDLKTDNSQLKSNISNVTLELEASKLELNELNASLRGAEDEKKTLISENSTVMNNLKQAEISVEMVQNEVMQLREVNKAYEVENSLLASEVADLKSELQQAEEKLGEKLSEVASLGVELENALKEASDQIEGITARVNTLEMEKNVLIAEKNELEEKNAAVTCRSAEDQTLIKNLQDELISRSSNEEITLKAQKDSFDELFAEHKKLEEQFRESCQKLEIEQAMKEETVQTLEAIQIEKEKEIEKLEESCKEYLEKIQFSEAENARLHKHVQNLEVQIRLCNQKLKITETENKEKEEGYIRTTEALRGEHKIVEDRASRLSSKMHILNKEVKQVMEVAEAGISALATGYSYLESTFEENSGQCLKQLSVCHEELELLKKEIIEIKSEKQELSARLKYKEGIISMIKGESESTSKKLAKKETELAIVRVSLIESEERMNALEDMLREKKMEIVDKDEEKREVIRQLCLLIEYHRENCDHLYKYLNAVTKRGGQRS